MRAEASPGRPSYNKGGLAFWFVRAERYEPTTGVPFRTVPQRKQELEASPPKRSTKAKRRRAQRVMVERRLSPGIATRSGN